jgi:cobalt transporter subunit CbtA
MLFRGIIFNALLVGLLTGVLLSVAQQIGVVPIIFAAEQYETTEVETKDVSVIKAPAINGVEAQQALKVTQDDGHSDHDHGAHDHHGSAAEKPLVGSTVKPEPTVDDHAGHVHNDEAWAPEDGIERTFYTYLSNILAAIGFAAVMLALMIQVQLQELAKVSVARGLLWGGAGFVAFFAAPGVGLPPEIPGIEAAAIESRQSWWLLTVLAVAAGLAIVAFAPKLFKLAGIAFIALPYVIGAPHPADPAFTHPDPAAVAALSELHERFIFASGVSNLIFWLALGAASAWMLNRWLSSGADAQVAENHV